VQNNKEELILSSHHPNKIQKSLKKKLNKKRPTHVKLYRVFSSHKKI
jgi:hypothetical protein